MRLKGLGLWRSHVGIADFAVAKKRSAILTRLSHAYLLRSKLSETYRKVLLGRIVLDMYRLRFLIDREPVPARQLIAQRAISEGYRALRDMGQDSFMGIVYEEMVASIVCGPRQEIDVAIAAFLQGRELGGPYLGMSRS